VLVIDDSAASRALLEQQLRAWGVRSNGAADAHTALGRLQAGAADGDPYALALVDVQMPGVDGFELANRIEVAPELAGLPLLLITTVAQREQVEAKRPATAVAILTKPVRQARLREALAQAAERARGRSTAGGISGGSSARRSPRAAGSSPR
jgi:CheY-like chemotaxis protein